MDLIITGFFLLIVLKLYLNIVSRQNADALQHQMFAPSPSSSVRFVVPSVSLGFGRGSRVEGTKSRVEGNMSRVLKNENKIIKIKIKKIKK